MEQVKAFDFENNPTITMDIDTLKRTYKENDVLGKPLRGMYHYEVIDAVNEILEKYNYQHQINEIFAAQNRDLYKQCVHDIRARIRIPLMVEKSFKTKLSWLCYFVSPYLMARRSAVSFIAHVRLDEMG